MKLLATGFVLPAIVMAAMTLGAPAAHASLVFDATLTGTGEVPPNGSTATGSAVLTLTGNTLEVDLSFSGLTGGVASAAHIHCCTAPGTNTMVAIPFVGFPATTSGTYDHFFDLTSDLTYTAGFLAAEGGTALGAEGVLIAGLGLGHAYVNIHDAMFPGGEIRGFDTPKGSVPEPASLLLFGSALAGLGWLRRRGKAA